MERGIGGSDVRVAVAIGKVREMADAMERRDGTLRTQMDRTWLFHRDLKRKGMRERERSKMIPKFLAWRTGCATSQAREYMRKMLITGISW